MGNENAFKHKVGRELVQKLATASKKAWPAFDQAAFETAFGGEALAQLEPLELKERIDLVTRVWAAHLPDPYLQALPIVLATMAPPLGEDLGVVQALFYHWVHGRFVESFGLAHVDESLAAMVEITQRSTAEFCVRPFLLQHPSRTLSFMAAQRSHPSPHVRRWVSEGTRPRLPWGLRLTPFVQDPQPVLELIAPLRRDPSEYVRNSVANSLNDIAKDHPALVVSIVRTWLAERDNPYAAWIAKRALRHLIKQGHGEALLALGFAAGTQVVIQELRVDVPRIEVGQSITFSFVLEAAADESVCLDYAIDYRLAGGKTGRKVFKLKTLAVKRGQRLAFKKRHSFKPITTRRYYGGEHAITLLANGQPLGAVQFTLAL